MNHYQARRVEDGPRKGLWDWTCYNDHTRKTWPWGPCRDNNCHHKTREEAEMHYAREAMERFLEIPVKEIDTRVGTACDVKGCFNKAFKERVDPRGVGKHHRMCDGHMKNPPLEHFHETYIISSY